MKRELLIIKRKKAKALHKKGYSQSKIAKALVAGRDKVAKWLKMTDEEVSKDNRGWPEGKLRTHTQVEKAHVLKIKRNLKKEKSYFYGADIIGANYKKENKKNISKWFIKETIKKAGLTDQRKKKQKGGSRYMNYPEKTLSKLGKIVVGIDFMGPKYLKDDSDGKHFLSCKYIRPLQYGIVKRIESQTTNETLKNLVEIWKKQPIPDVIKIDNDKAFGGNMKVLGRFTRALLNLGIIPIFSAERCPWNNGSVEGYNSVFSRKFWNKISFSDEEEVDIEIKKFNFEYEKYSTLINNNPKVSSPCYVQKISGSKIKITNHKTEINLENKIENKFRNNKIYFLRKVKQVETKSGEEHGQINVYSKKIKLNKKYINRFTLNIINIKKKEIEVFFETDAGKLISIKKQKFVI
jgi:predicted transcriptional regulator